MKYLIKTIFLMGGLLISVAGFSQTTYYVKAGSSGSGASWTDASGDLQAMINKSVAGDQVWVSEGTYKPQEFPGATGTLTSRDVSFVLKSGVKIIGGFAGSESQLSQRKPDENITILSGDIGTENQISDNAYHVVVSANTSSETLLDGFLIRDGNANASGSVQVSGVNISRFSGGGIYANSSNAVFKNVTIHKNQCSGGEDFFGNGGGIYATISQLTLEDAVLSENESKRVADKAGGTSGAIFISGTSDKRSALFLTRVKVEKNTSMNTVGAITVSSYTDATFLGVDFVENKTANGLAGALRIAGASATDFNNFKMDGGSFLKNTAPAAGGAVYVWSFTNYTFNNIIFSENKSTGSAGGAMFLFSGGGSAAPNDKAFITNCVFYNNQANGSTLGGGGVFVSNGTQLTLTNSTFYDNYAKFDGGGMGVFSNAVVKADISNCIFYNNKSEGENKDFYIGPLSGLDLSYSITQKQGEEGVNGILKGVDPLFSSTDPSTEFFLRLLEASPAINAGNNDKIPEGIATDLAGNERIIDNIVDLGAFEFKDTGGPTISQTLSFEENVTRTYGDPVFDPGATSSSGLPVTYSVSNTNVAVFEDGKIRIIGAGTTELTASQPGNFEYLPATDISRSLIIKTAPLTIRAADTSMIQGDQMPEFRIIYEGLKYEDTEDALKVKPIVSTTATSSSQEGEYALTISGAQSDNYHMIYETGTLKIVQKYEEGKIRFVKPVASGSGSGLNWENASSDLQEMINAAAAGGEVWVAKGVYKPSALPGATGTTGGRDVSFVLKSGVGVYGGFKGDEVRRSERDIEGNETVLSGDVGVQGSNSDNAYHVVLSVKNTTGTILDGFTITDGVSGGTGSYSIEGLAIDKSSGAGIYVIEGKGVLFDNLKITGNNIVTSGVGGGLFVKKSELTIRNSEISENITNGSTGQGAGIYLIGEAGALTETRFVNVAIRKNQSVRTGGAGYIGSYTITRFEDSDIEDNRGTEGAGIHLGSGQVAFKNQFVATGTNFKRNEGLATGNGGAMLVAQYNQLEFSDCEFSDNIAGYQGGAMYINGNAASFTRFIVDNCRFSGNKLLQASGNGGALRINFFVDAWVKNSTFNHNESSGGAAVSFVGSSDSPSQNFYLINSVFYNNKSTGLTSGGGAVSTGNYMKVNVINCTFYNNEAINDGGAIRIAESRTLGINVYNSVFAGNKAVTGKDMSWPPNYPDVDMKNNYTQEAGIHGENGVIIGDDPKFESTDPENDKFLHLSILSDAINKGENTLLPSDITRDKAGKDRIIYNVLDMGAYEYDGPPLNPTTDQAITVGGNVSKMYGDPEFDPEASSSSGLPVSLHSSNTAVAIVTSDRKIRLVGAGTAEITASQPGNAQYHPADPVSFTLTVSKAPLIIRPDNLTVEQGKEFPVFTATYTGLVNDDTEGSVAVPPSITTDADENSPVGVYELKAADAQSNKYEIVYESGQLTIIERVWEPAEKIKWEAWFSSNSELQIEVDMIKAQNVSIVIYTQEGIPVYRESKDLHPGTNRMIISAGRLLPGIYIVNLRGAGVKLEKKIIKR